MLQSEGRRYAYLVIPYSGDHPGQHSDPLRRDKWGEDLFHLTNEAKRRGAEGWILDLRGNTGGYLGPMLAGLQALLGNGTVLKLRGPDSRNTISIKDRAVLNHAGFARVSVEAQIEELRLRMKRTRRLSSFWIGEHGAPGSHWRPHSRGTKENAISWRAYGWSHRFGNLLGSLRWRSSVHHVRTRLRPARPRLPGRHRAETRVQDPKRVTKFLTIPPIISAEEWLSHMPPR